jgi:hypothetical protein
MRPSFVVVLVAGFTSPGCGQTPTGERASFVTVLGRDTVVIESFVRTASRVEGDMVIRVPATVRQRYTVDRGSDGRFTKSVVETIPLGTDDIAARKVSPPRERDSLRSRSILPVSSAERHVPRCQTPFPCSSPASMNRLDCMTRSACWSSSCTGGGERHAARHVRGQVHRNSDGRSNARRFRRRSAHEVDADYFKIAWTHLTLDDSARILSADARETTEKTESRTHGVPRCRAGREIVRLP